MRIAHISDLHCTHITWNPLRLLSKRIFGHLNWLYKRGSHFSEEPLDALPQLLQELGVDHVLLGGDFTTTSMKEEYLRAQKFVSRLPKWIAVPGNHDHYTYWSFKNRLFYRYFGNKKAEFFTLQHNGVEAHKIAPRWWVVALDTARATLPHSSRGLFSRKLEERIKEALKLIPPDDEIIMLNHYPFFQNDEPKRNLARGEALMALLQKEKRVRLYLHGHTHRHTLADLQPNGLPVILDSGSCTQKNRASWNLIDLHSKGCEVSVYRWNKFWEKTHTESLAWTR
jgi:3',5'-cyclic AMP phosphodiesterase CpdA